MSWKHLLHLHFASCNVQDHVISLILIKIQHYDWMQEEMEYFSISQRKNTRFYELCGLCASQWMENK